MSGQVSAARSALDAIERRMLDAPSLIPALREDREQALRELAQAESAERVAAKRALAIALDEIVRAAQRDPSAPWFRRHRQHHSPAAKSVFLRRLAACAPICRLFRGEGEAPK